MSLIFERILGAAAAGGPDEHSGQIARGLQRLPLAQADEALSGAIRGVMGDTAEQGWLRRKVQGWLLEAVRKYTLAQFRSDRAEGGGVDLALLQEELEQSVDEALARRSAARCGSGRYWWPLDYLW